MRPCGQALTLITSWFSFSLFLIYEYNLRPALLTCRMSSRTAEGYRWHWHCRRCGWCRWSCCHCCGLMCRQWNRWVSWSCVDSVGDVGGDVWWWNTCGIREAFEQRYSTIMAAIMRPERPESSRNVFSAKPERANQHTRKDKEKRGKGEKHFTNLGQQRKSHQVKFYECFNTFMKLHEYRIRLM